MNMWYQNYDLILKQLVTELVLTKPDTEIVIWIIDK